MNYPEWRKGFKNSKREPIDFHWNPMSENKGKRAKYIILSGNKKYSPNNPEEIEELVSDRNKNGENIKIVIGNIVAAEGLDLKNIREIHILDPWYHLSRIEQIIGRGIRYCSHSKLDKEERNVTVYMHVAGVSRENESMDTYTYRLAEEKAGIIGKVEQIMKENAIDCYLNQQINQIKKKQLLPIQLTTSRNIQIPKFELHDRLFSKVCSFSECNYSCENSSITEKQINYDTFSMRNSKDLFKHVKNIIIEMFVLSNHYSLNEIEKRVMETIDTNKTIIYYALFNMIDQKTTLWNHNYLSGYLLNRDDYYLFQPHISHDLSLPLYYRNLSVERRPQKYIPLTDDLFNKEEGEREVYLYEKVYKDLLEEIHKNELLEKDYGFENYIDNFQEGNYIDIYYDNLLYEEKLVLFKEIFKEYIQTGKTKDKDLFKYFQNNLIYKDNHDYFILEEKGEVIGFFLMNTGRLLGKKGKDLDEIENDYDYFIYKSDQFFELSELDDGNLIRMNIKTNFLKIKEKTPLLKTGPIWGYNFKLQNGKNVFKLVDDKLKKHLNKFPGRVVSQIAKKNSVRAFIKIYFNKNYETLMSEDPDIEGQSKEFLYLFIEMIVRNKEKNKLRKAKHAFLSYDLVFLKYIQ